MNEQTALTTMHTIWMREHNRKEERLHYINPHWNGNTVLYLTYNKKNVCLFFVQQFAVPHFSENDRIPMETTGNNNYYLETFPEAR